MSKYWISEIPSLATPDLSLPQFLPLSLLTVNRDILPTFWGINTSLGNNIIETASAHSHASGHLRNRNVWARFWGDLLNEESWRRDSPSLPNPHLHLAAGIWVSGHLWKVWICSWFFSEGSVWACCDLRCLQGPFTSLIHSLPRSWSSSPSS